MENAVDVKIALLIMLMAIIAIFSERADTTSRTKG